MSAEQYDADPGAMPQAQAAVDILPVQASRKGRPPEPEPTQSPVDPTWAQPAVTTNPWTGVVDPAQEPPVDGQPVAEQPVAEQADAPVAEQHDAEQAVAAPESAPTGPTPLVYAGAIPPPVSVPVFPGAGVPVSDVADPADTEATTPGAKRFLGMQLRRPRRVDGSPADETDQQPDGPEAPVAAWPTDFGVGVVAHAEPESPAQWGPPVGYAVTEVPAEAPADVQPPLEPPFAAVETAEQPVVEAAPAAPTTSVEPVAAIEPVAVDPVAVEPVAVEPVATPLPVPPADDELRSMRTLVEASDARRVAAEHRADNAVAYAQQLQSELTRVQSELESKLQAAEVRVRSNANEAQDWQIRHREAQTQITELAASLAGAEQRLADVRAERDDLMSQLEDVTSPDRETVAEQLES